MRDTSTSRKLTGRICIASNGEPEVDGTAAFLHSISMDCFWYPTMREILGVPSVHWKRRWKRAMRFDHRPFWGGPSPAFMKRQDVRRMVRLASTFGIELE